MEVPGAGHYSAGAVSAGTGRRSACPMTQKDCAAAAAGGPEVLCRHRVMGPAVVTRMFLSPAAVVARGHTGTCCHSPQVDL